MIPVYPSRLPERLLRELLADPTADPGAAMGRSQGEAVGTHQKCWVFLARKCAKAVILGGQYFHTSSMLSNNTQPVEKEWLQATNALKFLKSRSLCCLVFREFNGSRCCIDS